MNRSLRSRLMLGVATTIVAGFVVGAVVIYGLMRASLLEEFDALLAAKARALATLVEQRGSVIEIEFAEHPMQEFARKVRPEYFQVWDQDAAVIARSTRLADEEDLERASGSLAAPGYQFLTLPDGRPGRQVAIQFMPAVDGEDLEHGSDGDGEDDDDEHDRVDFSSRRRITLVVARETAEIDQALARLSWMLLGVSSVVIMTTLGVVAWLVKRNLSPLDELAMQVAKLDEHELAARFRIEDAPSELAPIVTQLNDLLSRLEEAFQRERDFSADVAHELRTPLAGLRSTLEVALSRERGNEEYEQVLRECEQMSVDTQRVVETLLSLARIESGQMKVERSLEDLDRLIASSWRPFERKAAIRSLTVSFGRPSGVLIHSDAKKLQVVMANLFSNAVDYTDEGGTIEVDWTTDEQQVCITVVNSGCQLSEEQMQRVFDRFWRADAARTSTGTHAGLGLSLCRRIVHLLGGSIVAERRNSSFVVTLDLNAEFVVDKEVDDESAARLPMSESGFEKERATTRQASTPR